MEPDPDIIADTKSYVSTEFFFYMLPNYLAILALAYRYWVIMQHPPKRKVDELPGEIVVTCFEESYDEDYYNEQDHGIPPASYCIKSKLSLINSYLYLIMCLMGFLGDPDLYYAAQHRTYSLLYILGVVSWQMSALVLRRQYQRQLYQSLWAHRFFWIFCGTFSISKMFQDYLQPLNFIVNSLFLVINGVLALYGLYRPEDKGDAFLQIDTETPSFAKIIFQKIQLDPTIRKILRIKDQPQQTITIPMDTDLTNNELEQIQITMASISPQQQLKLLNKLPKRNIFINRKTRTKIINQQIKFFFVIIIQLNNERFEVERKYSQFQDLDYSLSMHYSEQNFPKLQLPRLKRLQFNRLGEQDNARRAEILEEWLQALLQNPIFINQSLLQFLKIDPLNSAPFVTYYNASYKNFCSKSFLYSSVREKNNLEMKQQRVSILNVVQNIVMTNQFYFNQIKDYEFVVSPQSSSLKTKYYIFDMVCKIPGKIPLKWSIKKQQEQFSTLNKNIEEQLKKQVPFYYQCMLKIPDHRSGSDKITSKKLQAFSQYLRKLLLNSEYYSFALFKFINFNFIDGEVTGDNKAINYQSLKIISSQKIGKILTLLGLPFEVQKIEIKEQLDGSNSYKFILVLGDKKLSKTHHDLIQLRNHLLKIYKNLATIPELYDFSKKLMSEQLDKIKHKTDEFLCGIIGLPQIRQNITFDRFINSDVVAEQ